jgi:hypothetical protein
VLPVKDPCLLPPKIRLPVWLQDLDELLTWAQAQPRPKSDRKRSNRARPDALDGYLALLVQFFMRRGGYPGKARSSPCVKFVVAAASPVLSTMYFTKLKPGAISNLIRSRIWLMGQDFASLRTEVGAPTLTVND